MTLSSVTLSSSCASGACCKSSDRVCTDLRRGLQDGRSALYQAASNGQAAAVKVLLDNGADANLQQKVTGATRAYPSQYMPASNA